MARRISIDPLGLMAARSPGFHPAKRRRRWFMSRPRLLVTVLFFGIFWMWLNLWGHKIVIPEDPFEYLQEESLKDIRNETLGFQKILVLNLPFRTDRRDAMALSAAVSGMKLEYIDGVRGDDLNVKAYPPPDENRKLLTGIRGSWRTHMTALQRVIEQNLTTAFILEDDVDWDIHVRQSLQRFALASRFLSSSSTSNFLSLSPSLKSQIDERPNSETAESAFRIISAANLAKKLFSLPLPSILSKPLVSKAPQGTHKDAQSPYGNPDDWDILWLGHCGAGMPRSMPLASHPPSEQHYPPTTANIVLTSANDISVPAPKHLKAHPFQGDLDALATTYPPHTRLYHRSTGGQLCTVGYAVSQRGARRLLHQFGVKGWNGIFDAEMGRWCAGVDPDMGSAFPPSSDTPPLNGPEKERVCVTSQPPIFAHHHPVQGESDIGGLGGGFARKHETKYLRRSVRMNLEGLVNGTPERGIKDQWPDE